MATNVNLLDRAPSIAVRALNWTLAPLEDPVGTDRPLWRDYSRWQGFGDLSVAVANGVLGFAARAGISWGYQDPYFPHYWSQGGEWRHALYRTSYHVIYPDQPVLKQLDENWYKVHPEIDIIPRVIDLELDRDQEPQKIAMAVWEMSEIIKARDGVRPWIYSRRLLIDKWLASWTTEMLNDHYWWLAQYLWDRVREHPGPPTLPDRIREENVVLHQTADKKQAPPGEVESYSVDWDRWELGGVANMHKWIDERYGDGTPEPPEPEPQIEHVWVTANLNVREGASVNTTDIGTLAKGSDVTIRRNGDWGELFGNISMAYTSPTPEDVE